MRCDSSAVASTTATVAHVDMHMASMALQLKTAKPNASVDAAQVAHKPLQLAWHVLKPSDGPYMASGLDDVMATTAATESNIFLWT